MAIGEGKCHRHLSGVSSIRLFDVRGVESVEVDPASGEVTAVRLTEAAQPIDVLFVERSASYSETLFATGGVEHRLEFTLRGCRPEAVEQLQNLSLDGVLAEVATPNGLRLLVGYSSRAECDYPLRLSAASAETLRAGERMPETTVTLISKDGWFSREMIAE